VHDGEDEQHQVSVYAAVGGQRFFDHLVERFYARVAHDEVLLSLYPDQVDLLPAQRRLSMFLAQYWGGPDTYSSERGHPRLRMRHLPFTIDERAARHWVDAMSAALAETMPETPLDDELRAVVAARMEEYFRTAAGHMRNT
jgi:hemoglobin